MSSEVSLSLMFKDLKVKAIFSQRRNLKKLRYGSPRKRSFPTSPIKNTLVSNNYETSIPDTSDF